MMFAQTLLLGAFAALAVAQSDVLAFTRVPNPVTDGEQHAILYATNDTQSPVTILLRKGPANNLQTIDTLTTSATGGQYIWTPPVSLANGQDYALEIRQAGQNNYFGPFTVQGAQPSAVASASASSAAHASGGHGSVTSAASNSTVSTGTASAGTGTPISRNTTLSSPTLTPTGPASTGPASTTGGAGFETSSAAGPASTDNAAASDLTGKSTVAFVLGALAAVMYLH